MSIRSFFEDLSEGFEQNVKIPAARWQAAQFQEAGYEKIVEELGRPMNEAEFGYYLEQMPDQAEVDSGEYFGKTVQKKAEGFWDRVLDPTVQAQAEAMVNPFKDKDDLEATTGQYMLKGITEGLGGLLEMPAAIASTPGFIAEKTGLAGVLGGDEEVQRIQEQRKKYFEEGLLSNARDAIKNFGTEATGISSLLEDPYTGKLNVGKAASGIVAQLGTYGLALGGGGAALTENALKNNILKQLSKSGFTEGAKQAIASEFLAGTTANAAMGLPLSLAASVDRETGEVSMADFAANTALDFLAGGAIEGAGYLFDAKKGLRGLQQVAETKRALKNRTAKATEQGLVAQMRRAEQAKQRKLAERKSDLERKALAQEEAETQLLKAQEEAELLGLAKDEVTVKAKEIEDFYTEQLDEELTKLDQDFQPEFEESRLRAEEAQMRKVEVEDQLKQAEESYAKKDAELRKRLDELDQQAKKSPEPPNTVKETGDIEFEIKRLKQQKGSLSKKLTGQRKKYEEQLKAEEKKVETEIQAAKAKPAKGTIGEENIAKLDNVQKDLALQEKTKLQESFNKKLADLDARQAKQIETIDSSIAKQEQLLQEQQAAQEALIQRGDLGGQQNQLFAEIERANLEQVQLREDLQRQRIDLENQKIDAQREQEALAQQQENIKRIAARNNRKAKIKELKRLYKDTVEDFQAQTPEGIAQLERKAQGLKDEVDLLREDFEIEQLIHAEDLEEVARATARIRGLPIIDNWISYTNDMPKTNPDYKKGNFMLNVDDPMTSPIPTMEKDLAKQRRREPNFLDKILQPLYSRLGKVSLRLAQKFRTFEMDAAKRANNYTEEAAPFFEKFTKVVKPEDQATWDHLIKMQDIEGARALLSKYDNVEMFELPPFFAAPWRRLARDGQSDQYYKDLKKPITELFDRIPKLLEAVHRDAVEAGVDVGYRENYFPTSVADYDYWQKKVGTVKGKKGEIDSAIATARRKEIDNLVNTKEAELGRELTIDELTDIENSVYLNEEQQARIANQAVLGEAETRIGDEFARTEMAQELDLSQEDTQTMYRNSLEALNNYLNKSAFDIQKSKFMGNAKAEEGIGAITKRFIDEGLLEAKDLPIVQDTLRKRFVDGVRGSGEYTKMMRDVGNIVALGDIATTIRNLGDIPNTVILNGLDNTLIGLAQASFGEGFKPQDLGINEVVVTLNEPSKLKAIQDFYFKANFMKPLDMLMKATSANAAFNNLKKMSKKTGKTFDNFYKDLVAEYGTKQANELLDNARKFKNIEEAAQIDSIVDSYVYNQLAKVQPINLGEMPADYLKYKGTPAELFYMLKGFFLKQLNFTREQTVTQIRQGLKNKDLNMFKNGLQNLMAFTVTLGAPTTMAINYFIDALQGRENTKTVEERYIDANLAYIGGSRYDFQRARDKGILNMLFEKAFSVPKPLFDSIGQDYKYIQDQIDKGENINPLFTKTWRGLIPGIGKTLWANLEGGKAQTEKQIKAKERRETRSKKKKSSIRFKG